MENKFRVKEMISNFNGIEKHVFFPQYNLQRIQNRWDNIVFYSYDSSNESNEHWVYLTNSGYNTLEEAKESCKIVKKEPSIEVKYHEI